MLSSTARRISSTALSTSNGLARYSNAPPWNAATALSRSENAVMMMTGKPGHLVAHGLQQFEAGTAGHADVGHEYLRTLLFERGQRVADAGKTARREVLSCERFFKHPADGLVVVYYPDRLHIVRRDVFVWFGLSPSKRSGALALFKMSMNPRNRSLTPASVASIVQAVSGQPSNGNKIVNSVQPGLLSTSINPSCCCTKVCASVRPSPLPSSRPDTSG